MLQSPLAKRRHIFRDALRGARKRQPSALGTRQLGSEAIPRDKHGGVDGVRAAARRLGVTVHVCERLGEQRRGVQHGARIAPDRIPAVAQATRATPCCRTLAADPNGELRRRLGRESHPGKAHEVAVHGRVVLRPQRAEGADVFVGRRTPAVESRRTQNGQFLGHPADPDPQRQPTPGQHVQGGQHLGGQHRRAVHQHHHRGEQPDALGGRCGPGQRRDLLKARARIAGRPGAGIVVGIARRRACRDDDVIAEAEMRQPQTLAVLRHPLQAIGARNNTPRAEMQTEFHAASFLACQSEIGTGAKGRRGERRRATLAPVSGRSYKPVLARIRQWPRRCPAPRCRP